MRIYCSTADGTLKDVGLSFQDVAENLIDPWRIDLADPEPVVERSDRPMFFRTRTDVTDGRRLPPLSFRRLRDVCFAYCDEHGMIFVGVHDGIEPYCVSGKQREGAHDIELTGVEVSKTPFSEHFDAYLRQYNAVETTIRGDMAFRMSPPVFGSPNPPRSAASAKLRGNTLTVHRDAPALWGKPITFVGEMFAERSFTLPLHEDIISLLKALERWEPIVYGRAIRDCLKGRKPEAVDVSIKAGELRHAEAFLWFNGKKTSENFDVTVPSSGMVYVWNGLNVRFIERSAETPGNWMLSNANFYSVDCMWASRQNEGWSNRIALMDFGHNRARALSNFPQHTMSGSLIHRHISRLRAEKIEVILTPVA